MRLVRCFDVVDMTLEDTSKSFRKKYSLDMDRFELVKDFCKKMDDVVEENECDAVEAFVDEASGSLKISLISMDLVFENGRNNKFYEMISYVDEVKFSAESSSDIRIDFIFKNLWRD